MVANPSAPRNEPVAGVLPVIDLVKALGGGAVVAEACGVSPQAVSNWGADGRIPARHHAAMWRLAQSKGVDWTPPGFDGLRLIPMPVHSPDATVTTVQSARENTVKADEAA